MQIFSGLMKIKLFDVILIVDENRNFRQHLRMVCFISITMNSQYTFHLSPWGDSPTIINCKYIDFVSNVAPFIGLFELQGFFLFSVL